MCWKPPQTLEAKGICPVCGRKLTIGVLHRVEKLADREEGERPDITMPFESLIPLPEIIGSVLQVGPTSKRVQRVYETMLADLGAELKILRELSIEEIADAGDPLIAEGIRRMRVGEVHIDPGYDGVYGKIQVFSEEDRAILSGQDTLFLMPEKESPKSKVKSQESVKQNAEEASDLGPSTFDFRPDEDGLDVNQEAAVTMEEGPVVVIAGPGTGKTRVLTHRVVDLIQNRGVSPGSIMAVTFTNRAAGEMWERIVDLSSFGEELVPMRVGTFHRLALNLLREYAPDRVRVIADAGEARGILREVIAELGYSVLLAHVVSDISLQKSSVLQADDADDEFVAICAAYQKRLSDYGLMDFDDILLALRDLLRGEVLQEIQNRFSHVLVDEFQDVNAVQYEVIKLLAGEGHGLFVIGDPDQAIYGFRGASPVYFERLVEDFPQAKKVVLERTFRSTPQIVSAASNLLSGRSFVPVRADGPKLRLLSTPSEIGEGIAVVDEISQMMGGADLLEANEEGKRSLEDFAVLFRTGRQADALEKCFSEAGIPYRVVGQKSYLDAESVRQTLAFFKYVMHGESKGLLEVLTMPAFDPGREERAALRAEILKGDLPGVLPDGVQKKVDAVGECVNRFRPLMENQSPTDLLNLWATEFGVAEDVDFERLTLLAQGADSFSELLEVITLGQDADLVRHGMIQRPEAVTLMTLHASKGLEFPVVFVCGVEEDLIPFRDADVEEERRLFFVGITRGQDEVILTRARRRMRFGERLEPEVSRFVADIPADVIDTVELRTERRLKPSEQMSLF